MIRILNETLKKHQISVETRKEIYGDSTFEFSMLIDQGEINDMTPVVNFYKEEDEKLYMRSQTFAFHEYAYGNTHEVFQEENES
jgi:hypothetical protein